MKRVGFLYNHDAAHQVAHLAGIMRALALTPGFEVWALVTRPLAEQVARRLVGDAEGVILWRRLRVTDASARAGVVLDRLFPFTRLRVLRENAAVFSRVDAIVSSERTCVRIKWDLGARSPRLIHVPHGSGDRNVAHHPQLKEFDYNLLSGQKLIDNGIALGLFRADQATIIGYPSTLR